MFPPWNTSRNPLSPSLEPSAGPLSILQCLSAFFHAVFTPGSSVEHSHTPILTFAHMEMYSLFKSLGISHSLLLSSYFACLSSPKSVFWNTDFNTHRCYDRTRKRTDRSLVNNTWTSSCSARFLSCSLSETFCRRVSRMPVIRCYKKLIITGCNCRTIFQILPMQVIKSSAVQMCGVSSSYKQMSNKFTSTLFTKEGKEPHS